MIHDAPTSGMRDGAVNRDAAMIHDAPTWGMRGVVMNCHVHWITTRQRPACARDVELDAMFRGAHGGP